MAVPWSKVRYSKPREIKWKNQNLYRIERQQYSTNFVLVIKE